MKNRLGLTLVEVLMAVSVIAIGIFPLITALSGMVERMLVQRDQMSALTVGTMQMDAFLNGFQTVDRFLPDGAVIYPPEIPVIAPGLKARYLLDEDSDTLDLEYNSSTFRTFTRFIKVEELSNLDFVTYRLELEVWKVAVPVPDTATENVLPEWKNGDELLFELNSLYTQKNQLES